MTDEDLVTRYGEWSKNSQGPEGLTQGGPKDVTIRNQGTLTKGTIVDMDVTRLGEGSSEG